MLGRLFLSVCVIFAWAPGGRGQSQSQEASKKAVFLARMLGFMDWPEKGESGENRVFSFCVFGDHLLGFALSQELRATTINRERVEVRWVKRGQELKGCQAVFIGASGGENLGKLLEAARGEGILTIGDEAGFLDAGGAVELSNEADGVKFQVDLGATRNARVRMNARLLSLAKRVVRSGEAAGG